MAAYHRPDTLQGALDVLAERPVTTAAGCTDLFPATQARTLSGPVLDITGIPELRGISRDEGAVRIGATTSWTDVIRADLPPAFGMLKQAAREVGSVQIQNSGTVAGNICNASPAADGMPCLMALDAQVELASATGTRTLPLSHFVNGPRQTALEPGELVTAITIPEAATRGTSRFLKLGARKYLVISIAMVAVRLDIEGDTVCDAALAVGACSAVATRLTDLEATLTGQSASDLSQHITHATVAAALSPIDDIRADGPYRAHAAAELLRRAIDDLTQPAKAAA